MITKIIITVLGYGGACWVLCSALARNRKQLEQRRRTKIVMDLIASDEAVNWSQRAEMRDNAIERGEAA